MKKFIALAVLLMFLVPVAGCGCNTIKTDNGSISLDKGKMEVKTNDGGQAQIAVSDKGQSVALPDDYPKDIVPVIDNATVTVASRNEDKDKKVSYYVTLTSEKDIKDVYNFYVDALKDLTELNKSQMNDYYSISGVKGDKQIAVTVTPEDKDNKKIANVLIIIGPK